MNTNGTQQIVIVYPGQPISAAILGAATSVGVPVDKLIKGAVPVARQAAVTRGVAAVEELWRAQQQAEALELDEGAR